MKRVITIERDGKSTFHDVTNVSEIEPVVAQGMDIWGLWGIDGSPRLPYDGKHSTDGFYPSPGSVRVTLIRFGPDGQALNAEQDSNEVKDLLDDDGTHTTPTMDVGWIIKGELGLELDGGETVWFEQGDVVVQNGTSHKWINRSGEEVWTGWVVIGASQEGRSTGA